MAGFLTNIEKKSLANAYFREVLFTGAHSQLVVMSLKPGEDIGMETHGPATSSYAWRPGKAERY